MVTICKNCKYFYNAGSKNNLIWYNLICMHPETQKIYIDYTIGEKIIEEVHCRDINTEGKCKLFVEKKYV